MYYSGHQEQITANKRKTKNKNVIKEVTNPVKTEKLYSILNRWNFTVELNIRCEALPSKIN